MKVHRTHIWTASTVVVAALALLVTLNSRSLIISYHLWREATARRAFENSETVTPQGTFLDEGGKYSARMEYHRDRLVAHGYYFHAVYEMESVPDVGEVNSALWKRVRAAFPESFHSTMTYPDNVLMVWDVPSRRGEWEAFVEKYNIADSRDRYMPESSEERASTSP